MSVLFLNAVPTCDRQDEGKQKKEQWGSRRFLKVWSDVGLGRMGKGHGR